MRKEGIVSLNPWKWYLTFRNARLVTVEPVIFLYFFGEFLYASLIQQYIFNRYGLDKLKNDTSFPNDTASVCLNSSEIDEYTGMNGSYKVVERYSSNLLIYSLVANKFVSIAVSMIMGPLSDIYGRRPFIIVVAVGAIVQGVGVSLIVHFNFNVLLLILTQGLAGLGGDYTGMLTSTFSYISDVSSNRWRTMRTGLGQAVLFLAASMSQGLGGLWFEKLNCNLKNPLILYIACNAGIILYTLFLLPESLTEDDRKRMGTVKPKGMKVLLRGAMIFLFQIKEYSVWILWATLISVMFADLNIIGILNIQVLFFKAIDWGPKMIGIVQSLSQASSIAVVLLVLPILVALKLPDTLIVLIGLFFSYGMAVFMGLASITYQYFIGE